MPLLKSDKRRAWGC